MNNTKSTKRALLLSIMAMLLCVVLLVGTTFAWFTDSATSSGNIIKSGTLDVSMKWAKGTEALDNATWEDASTGAIFKYDKWEPGYVEVRHIKITNEGTLALKYQISIAATGEVSGLADVIDVYYLDPAEQIADRDALAGKTPMSNLTTALNGLSETGNGNLKAGESVTITIALKMRESAGNEYQNKSIGSEFAVQLVATQYTYESDSFDNQYDANATYPVTNSADLVAAIADAEAGSIVTLASGNFLLSAEQQVGEGVTIAGNGPSATTITTSTTPSGTNKTGLVIDNQNVTIKDTKINGSVAISSNEYCGVIDIREGGTTLDNVSISRSLSNASCVVIKNGVDSGETVTLKNSTFKGGFKTIDIVDGVNGTVIIDNCEITGVYTFNVNSASSQDLTVKVTDSKLHGWTSYGRIKEAIFTNTEFSKGSSDYDYLRPYADTTLTDCTFDSGFLMGAGTTGFTITLNNCVKNGVAVTAENVQSLLLDADDMDNLRGCTIIVNGTTVTLS